MYLMINQINKKYDNITHFNLLNYLIYTHIHFKIILTNSIYLSIFFPIKIM